VAPIPVTLADNRQAERRLILAFLGITLVMALIRTLLMQVLANGPITLITVSTLCAAYAWPVVPVVAVIRRWSRWRFVGTLLLWFVAAVALLSWRTNENVSFAQVFGWMLFDIGLPLIVVTALCLGSATRAVAPGWRRCSSPCAGLRRLVSICSRRWSRRKAPSPSGWPGRSGPSRPSRCSRWCPG
jgi:hypothetical protein